MTKNFLIALPFAILFIGILENWAIDWSTMTLAALLVYFVLSAVRYYWDGKKDKPHEPC